MISLAYADAVPAAASAPSPLMSMLPLVVIFVIFYFLLIRPQQRKLKEHKRMLEDIKKGDHVITSSGIYGVIVGVGETSFELKIADNVKIKVLKSAVTEKLTSNNGAEDKQALIDSDKK